MFINTILVHCLF